MCGFGPGIWNCKCPGIWYTLNIAGFQNCINRNHFTGMLLSAIFSFFLKFCVTVIHNHLLSTIMSLSVWLRTSFPWFALALISFHKSYCSCSSGSRTTCPESPKLSCSTIQGMQPMGSLESDFVYITEKLLRTFSGVTSRPNFFFRSFQAGFSINIREPYSVCGCNRTSEGIFDVSGSCTLPFPHEVLYCILFLYLTRLIVNFSLVEHGINRQGMSNG